MNRAALAFFLFALLIVTTRWLSLVNGDPERPALSVFTVQSDSTRNDEQQKIAEEYLKYYSPQELEAALEAAYPLASCHEQAHGLGRAVYAQTQSLAETIAQCGTRCNQGCFHGALMQMFSTNSDTLGGVIEDERPEAYLAHVKSLASRLCTQPEVADVVQRNFCVHGIGHVFEYANGYKLDEGLESCRVFNAPYTASCVQGVYMEFVGNPERAEELRTTDVSFCNRFHKSAPFCYAYMARFWLAHDGKIIPLLKQCQALHGERPTQCIWGVIFSISSIQLLSTDDGIDKYCGYLSGAEYDACIDGAIEKVVDNDSSGTLNSCEALAPRFQRECTERLIYWQSLSR